ncbi:hypothetical protein D9M68_821930 [compost metagenome]
MVLGASLVYREPARPAAATGPSTAVAEGADTVVVELELAGTATCALPVTADTTMAWLWIGIWLMVRVTLSLPASSP